MAPPGGSTRVQLEPRARHCSMGMQPPPVEAGGPAAGGKQPAGGSGLPPPASQTLGETEWSPAPQGLPLLLLLQHDLLPGPQRMPSPQLGRCISTSGHCGAGLRAGAQEPIDRHTRLAGTLVYKHHHPAASLHSRAGNILTRSRAGSSQPGSPMGGGFSEGPELCSKCFLGPGSRRQQPHTAVFSLWLGSQW